MQAADIFMLKTNITQLGMDQRKVNMLAREIGPQLGYWKPVVVSHHMLMGLGKPISTKQNKIDQTIELKMSKSKPDTAIFMTDTTDDIMRQITTAYCPEGIAENNPILEYCQYILFESFDEIMVERPQKFGGTLKFTNYQELEQTFKKKQLHPSDLKQTVVLYLDKLLTPVRRHFEIDKNAKKLLEQVRSFQVTR